MNLQVRHWRRYGKDRTYCSTPGGDDLGWIDNATGQLHAVDAEAELLIKAWLRERGRSQDHEHAPELDAPPALPEFPAHPNLKEDLAQRRAGAAARERAEAESANQGDRSAIARFFDRLTDAKTPERSWRVGANGEEKIGGYLEQLRPYGWHVLHAIPIGDRGSDIDHLLIGPGGVWTINTKFHPGKRVWVSRHQVRINNHPVPYLRNSEYEAARVRTILHGALGWEVHVRAALVFMTGTWIPNVRVVGEPDNVDIMHRANVRRRFKRMVPYLTPEEVLAIYDVARRPSTWSRTGTE